jgi:hypothetical protein
MGGSSAEKNAVFEFLHFGETSSAASGVSPGGRNHGGQNPPSFAGSTAQGCPTCVRLYQDGLFADGRNTTHYNLDHQSRGPLNAPAP